MTVDLESLRARDILSPLDYRLAQTLGRIGDESRAEVLCAAALASHQTREGHVCLDLRRLAAFPVVVDNQGQAAEIVGLPPEAHWKAALGSSALVGAPGRAEPLVLDGAGRLYLRRFWHYEQQLAQAIRARAAQHELPVDQAALDQGLARLFPPENGADNLQRLAALTALRYRLCVITGGPGTGKTSTVVKILALLLEQARTLELPPPRIALLAPTGKAAARLAETIARAKNSLRCEPSIVRQIPEHAATIHRALATAQRRSRYRGAGEPYLESDVVLVDEASMVDLELMARLISAIPTSARLLLLGDPDQLASVEAGAVFGDICRAAVASTAEINALRRCTVSLSRTYRYTAASGIGALAAAIKTGDTGSAFELLRSDQYPELRLVELGASRDFERSLRDTVVAGYTPFMRAPEVAAQLRALDRFRLLCAHRRGAFGSERLNAWIGDIAAQHLEMTDRAHPTTTREPIAISRNDYRLELYNGDIGLLLSDPSRPHAAQALFLTSDGSYRAVSPWELPAYERAFVMSVHKSQGSEFDEVAVLLPAELSPVLSRELLYTAITRARVSVTIYASAEVVRQTIARRVERASGLSDALSSTP
jgi:exodeoxyribonuclease V alpha subunit